MQTNDFPPKYNKQVDEQANKAIEEARQKCSSIKSNVQRQRTSEPKKSSGATCGATIGSVLGFFVCIGACAMNVQEEFSGITAGITAYAIVVIVCLILGFFADSIAKDEYNTNESRIASRIEDEDAYLENRISEITKESIDKKYQYWEWFKKTSKHMSPRFAESELAKEVIEWMLTGFYNAIESADRRPHIETITVPFVFTVYNDKITCNLGTYDFKLKRCAYLRNPLEQTALANAIAAAMEIQTASKYPNDKTGNPVKVTDNFQYYEEYVSVTVTYTAINGNFENQRRW